MNKFKILFLIIFCAFFLVKTLLAQTITSVQYLDKNGILVKTPLKLAGPFNNSSLDIKKVTSSLRLYLSGADKKLTENPTGQFPGYWVDIDAEDSVFVWDGYFLNGDIVGNSYDFYVWALSPYVNPSPGQTTTYFRAEIMINSLVVATINFSSSSSEISSGTRHTVTGIDPTTSYGDTVKLKVSYQGGYGGTIVYGMGFTSDSHIDIPSINTNVSDDPYNQYPKEFSLLQNYPNPFNPETTIEFKVAKSTDTKITIHNVLSQTVRTLVNEKMNPGSYSVIWNSINDKGHNVPSGVYLCRMQAGDFVMIRKLSLLR